MTTSDGIVGGCGWAICRPGAGFRSLLRRWGRCGCGHRTRCSPGPGSATPHEFGNAAPQSRMGTTLRPGKYQPISEDCLTLNIVAPAAPSAELRP